MSEPTPGGKQPVKIYDRPESKGLSPILIAIIAIAVLLVGLVTYRFISQAQAVPKAQTSSGQRMHAAPLAVRFQANS